ncbi:hypothetical protein ABZ636_39825 [Streptomyces sp. NPDC007251]|uniref:hypothetical protein n=1 Tax=Streptomyces sp. NPDC007251 TaxID=3154483 RepID=UPI0033E47773
MVLRLAYLTITNAFAALWLLPMSDRDKDAEILALRHEIMVLERQLGEDRVKFASEDRAFLAALLVPLPRQVSAYGLCSPVAYGRTSPAARPLRSLARWP